MGGELHHKVTTQARTQAFILEANSLYQILHVGDNFSIIQEDKF